MGLLDYVILLVILSVSGAAMQGCDAIFGAERFHDYKSFIEENRTASAVVTPKESSSIKENRTADAVVTPKKKREATANPLAMAPHSARREK